MKQYTENILCKQLGIKKEIINYVNDKEKLILDKKEVIDKIREYNQYKVLNALQESRLSSTDFYWTTGYGYGDVGREKVEDIYSRVFNTDDALVRPTIASGTHALSLTLSGILRPGDELIYITGAPYDTLQQVIGSKGNIDGTLIEYGIKYNEVPLIDNQIDIDNVLEAINEDTKVIAIQRSTGYSDRRALTIDEIEKAITAIKNFNNDLIIMVDNCYGEFLDYREPTDVGADIMAGSLIKNPGGGIALSGGYVVGRRDLVEKVANRSTAPGLGKDTGLTFGTTRTTLQGLFLAPHIVSEAVKGALLVAIVYKSLGFKIVPEIDSFVTPEAWDMPGYEDPVIMAAGGFIEGSSIELSADGPMREPYYAYYQGGLTYDHCKLGVYKSLNNLYIKNLVKLI